MYDGGRRGLPMYDVRWTMYDLWSSRALREKLAKPGTQLRMIRAPFELLRCMIFPTPSAKASHSPRLWRAIIQIVHRT